MRYDVEWLDMIWKQYIRYMSSIVVYSCMFKTYVKSETVYVVFESDIK